MTRTHSSTRVERLVFNRRFSFSAYHATVFINIHPNLNFKRHGSACGVLLALMLSLSPAVGGASTTRFPARFIGGTAGNLDPTFGHSGFVLVPHTVYSVNDVRTSFNGSIVVAVDFAGMANAVGGFGIVRLLANGLPDDKFGKAGIAVAQFSSGVNAALSTATQPDGKIVAVGFALPLPRGSEMMAIARFNPNGTLDASFGSGGTIMSIVPGSTASAAGVVTVLPSAKLLIGGSAKFSSGIVNGVLVRLNPNGSLDTSFGSRGIVNTGLAVGINGLGLQSDGRIVALGGTQAVRLLPNGSFDTNPILETIVTETHNGVSSLTPNERIIDAESGFDGRPGSDIDAQTRRRLPDGSIDPSFQSPLFDFITTNPDIFQNVAHAIVTQQDGSVVIGGGGHTSSNATEFALARFLRTGTFDSTFGRGGIAVSGLDGNDEIFALGIQPNGDIIAAGQSFATGGLVVARYLGR